MVQTLHLMNSCNIVNWKGLKTFYNDPIVIFESTLSTKSFHSFGLRILISNLHLIHIQSLHIPHHTRLSEQIN